MNVAKSLKNITKTIRGTKMKENDVEVRESQVQIALVELRDTGQQLQDAIYLLFARLNNVIREDTPVTAKSNSQIELKTLVPLAKDIDEMTQVLTNLKREIEDFLPRLEN